MGSASLRPNGLGASGLQGVLNLLRILAMEVDGDFYRTFKLAAQLRFRGRFRVGACRPVAGRVVAASRLHEHVASRNAALLHDVLDRELSRAAGVEFGYERAFHGASSHS